MFIRVHPWLQPFDFLLHLDTLAHLQSVSQMGALFGASLQQLSLPPHKTFIPSFTRNPKHVRHPEVSRFQETILQSAIRQYLRDEKNLGAFLKNLNLAGATADSLEVLGEKALPQGYIDLFLKQRVPIGSGLKLPLEVKLGRAQPDDVDQLREYMNELMEESPSGILVAAEFSKRLPETSESGVKLVRYSLKIDLKEPVSFDEIRNGLVLEPVL